MEALWGDPEYTGTEGSDLLNVFGDEVGILL
jgi:hypothetical protein